MKKRLLSAFLVLVMLFTAIPITVVEAEASEVSELPALTALRSTFQADVDTYWNHKGISYETYNANRQYYNLRSTTTPCDHEEFHTDTIKTHCEQFGYTGECGCNSFSLSTQCMAFARFVSNYIFGTTPNGDGYEGNGWSSTSYDNLKSGDYIRWKRTSKDIGHSVIVLSKTDTYIKVLECNWDGPCKIGWDRKIYKSTLDSYYSVNYLTSDNNTSSPSHIDVGTNFYAYITNNWMDVTNDSNNVSLRNGDTDPNHVWYFERLDDGSYCITSALDGECMEVWNFDTSEGANVQTNTYNGNTAQEWYITGEPSEYILQAKCTDKVLTVKNGSSENGTNIQMNSYVYSSAQRFKIQKIENYRKPANIGTDFYGAILNDYYWKPISCGTNDYVTLESANGTASQHWYFQRQTDGTYIILNASNGYALEMHSGDTTTGNPVTTSEYWGGNYQKWFIYLEDGGCIIQSYHFTSKDLVLDLKNDNSANGTPITTCPRTNKKNQIWQIYSNEDAQLKSPSLSVTPGNSANKTTFTWNDVPGELRFDLKIWNGECGVGDAYYIEWGAKSDFSINLPAGTYEAYVDATNVFECKRSNVVKFTITDAKYTIKYNANGGIGAPVNQEKIHGTDLKLSSKAPTRNNYTFLGWDTSSNATTVVYKAGDKFTSNADTTLYAVWKADSYTVSYNANGGTNAPEAQTKTHDVELILSETVPTKNGYSFLGWDTSSSASTVVYNAGDKFTVNADTTLYAVWKADSYTVSYNANGGTNAPENQIKTHNTNLTLSETIPIKKGYKFLGWDTSNDANTVVYTPGDEFTSNTDIILYAVWQKDTFSIKFDLQGGFGKLFTQTKEQDIDLTLPLYSPYKTGYNFIGWSISPISTEVSYLPGDTYTVNNDITLYAIWEKAPEVENKLTDNITVNYYETVKFYTLTPSETAKYLIETENFSSSDLAHTIIIYDDNGNILYGDLLYTSKTPPDNNTITLSYTLEKGKTYHIGFCLFESKSLGEFKIGIYKGSIVTFDTNGGIDAPEKIQCYTKEGFIIPSKIPVKNGFTFMGWSLSPNTSSIFCNAGDSLYIEDSTTLYAVWKANVYEVNIDGIIHYFEPGQKVDLLANKIIIDATKAFVFDKWIVESNNVTMGNGIESLDNWFIMPSEDVIIRSLTYLVGDADQDSVITVSDILPVIFGIKQHEYSKYTDTDNDNTITASDITVIIQIMKKQYNYSDYLN